MVLLVLGSWDSCDLCNCYWVSAKIVFKGDLNVYVRTASKYDDCRLLHLPNLRLTLKLSWLCLADPNDHHSVVQCAPNKVPEYSSNQVLSYTISDYLRIFLILFLVACLIIEVSYRYCFL